MYFDLIYCLSISVNRNKVLLESSYQKIGFLEYLVQLKTK